MRIHDFLSRSAERFPDKTALVCGDQRVTYAWLESRAQRLGDWFWEQGLRPQDRVVVFLDNSVESVLSIFGVLKAGGIFIQVNPGVKANKLRYVLQDSEARFCIAHASKIQVVSSCFAGKESAVQIVFCPDLEGAGKKFIWPQNCKIFSWKEILQERIREVGKENRILDIDLAAIIYTSGSTGVPKGIMCAHYNMVSACKSITQYFNNTSLDIILSALPLSFDYGLYQVLMTFMFGGTLVLERSFLYPFKIMERLENEQATGFPLVPTMAALLLRMENLGTFACKELRYISNTAAALPQNHIQRLQKLFPQAQIFPMYGLTECKRVSYLPPADIERKPGSVGLPIPNEDVRIVNEQGGEVPVGSIGELVIRGANVMQGYWNAPEETARVFRAGRYKGETLLYSGDLFWQDDEGYLYFVGRKDDLLKSKGERVSPAEVESVLCELPGVSEAVVVGVADAILGCALKAFIVPELGWDLSERRIRGYCSAHLEPFMVPKYVCVCPTLPRSANGKVDKKALMVGD